MQSLPVSVLFVLCLCVLSKCTLSPKERKSKSEPRMMNIQVGPHGKTVFSKNLVQPEPTAKEILQHYQAFFQEVDEHRINTSLVLGFVTPWNNHGYAISKLFGNKFTHISPVWFELRRVDKEKYEITGGHNVDAKWMVHVRNAGRERGVKIVPRILFDNWNLSDYQALFKNRKESSALAKTLIALSKEHVFNGFVIEMWAQVVGHFPFEKVIEFINFLSAKLGSNRLETILVVPARRGTRPVFSEEHFDQLYHQVSAFVLMCYDYSSPQNPGPNAPIKWVEESILELSKNHTKRRKILTGLNFYGMKYSPSTARPIVGHEYVAHLKKYNDRLKYDFHVAENYMDWEESNGKHVIFFPSLYSIEKRLNLTREMGTGVSIWELGQGLDYFYDLL